MKVVNTFELFLLFVNIYFLFYSQSRIDVSCFTDKTLIYITPFLKHLSPWYTDEVDNVITNLAAHYNDGLCLELLLIDCATHVTQNDELICGSNGITYKNQ